MTANNDEFFQGFAWGVPLAFSDTLSRCRFEQGDLLYDCPEGYLQWEKAVKAIRYSIQVESPSQGFGRASEQAGVFEENWKSEVVFTLTNYPSRETREITTTQGRLYMLLWKNNWDTLKPDRECPTPITSLEASRQAESVVGDVKKVMAGKMAHPNVWVMGYDPTNSISQAKYKAVSTRFRNEFSATGRLFSLKEVGLEDALIVPTFGFVGLAIDEADSTRITATLKELLYRPAAERKTTEDKFRLSAAYSGGCRTLIPIFVGQRSDFCRTPFRFISDSVPG